MDALGIARDLGADHAGRVGLQLGTTNAADGGSSITSMSSAQADGQSCGQVECRMSILARWFMRSIDIIKRPASRVHLSNIGCENRVQPAIDI